VLNPDKVKTALADIQTAKEKQSPICFTHRICRNLEVTISARKTIELCFRMIQSVEAIILNGPMGMFALGRSAKGTFAITEVIAQNREAISIIGGGHSVKAINKSGHGKDLTFISPGGGASRECFEGTVLPGIAVPRRIIP
jgi:3-phosphoglycerate kinase